MMSMWQEHEGRMFATSGKDFLLYLGAGALGLVLALSGLGLLAMRVSCGEAGTGGSMLGLLQFIVSGGDPASFGRTADGCTASSSTILRLWAVAGAVIVGGIIGGIVWWSRYRESDGYLIKQLRRRSGIAKRQEIVRAVGPKAARKMTGKVRPTLPKKEQTPENGNFLLGKSEGVPCWIALEDSILLVGPPRSGKGVNVLMEPILDAPGPVITTSSRADNYAMTAPLRAKRGPVTLFDPQGLTGKPTTVKWSPITGCEQPQTANQRATSLISAAGLSASGNNSEWRAPAVMIMQTLLHAAAIGGASVDELMRWGNAPAEAKSAVAILKEAEARGVAAVGWAASLESEIDGDPRMRGNKWFGVSNAVSGLAVDSVRDALNPRSHRETFDIDQFIRESGTLYILGTKSGGSSAGPFLVAMMDAITERARQIAAKSVGNRLDPPLLLPLDEIANITAAWEGLVQLMADGGGVGITPVPVYQSMAQARNEWGREAGEALFDAATVKIQLGGASNTQDLEVQQKLAGPRKVTRASRSTQSDGSTVSEQTQDTNVLEISDMRRLPFGWSLVFYRNRRPMLVQMRPYWKRKDAKEIDAAKAVYAASLRDRSKEAEWDAATTWAGQNRLVEPSEVSTTGPVMPDRERPRDKSDIVIEF